MTDHAEQTTLAPELMTQRQVAEMFQRDPRTIRNWDRRGWLTPIHIGRSAFYRRSDVEKLAESGAI